MTRNVDEIWQALKSSRSPTETLKKCALSPEQDQPPLKELNSVAHTTPGDHSKLENDRFSQRDINCLSDLDRAVRKRAIIKLYSQISACSPDEWPSEVQEFFQRESSWRKLVTMLEDPSDLCREKALAVAGLYLSGAEADAPFIHQHVEALKRRMGVGASAVMESSEELRRGLAEFTATALAPRAVKCTVVEDVALLLVQFLGDAYHEAKKQACRGIVVLTEQCSADHLAASYTKLLDACVEALRHSHSRVRAAALTALSAVVQSVSVPGDLVGTQLVPAMQGLAADRSPELRAACFRACTVWLISQVELHKGSNASFHRLLPVLLLGLTDKADSIASETLTLVEQVGSAYCASECHPGGSEDPSPDTEDASESACRIAAANLPPPFNTRPSAAARKMMRSEVQNVLPSVLKDAHEWTTVLRCTASRSLYSIAALAESSVTRHLDCIIPALCQAVGDDDEAVTTRIIHCVHVVGAFCKAQHWMPLILDYAASLKGQPNSTVCALATMAGLEIAAANAQQPLPRDMLKRASEWLSSEDMRSLQHRDLQRQMVMVTSNLIDLAGPAVAGVAEPLFHCLMHLQGQHGLDSYTMQQIAAAQQKLATACGAASAVELAANHACGLMLYMLQRSSQWTATHADISSFVAILETCPGETLAAIGEPLCLSLSQITRDSDRDPALRMEILRAMHKVFEDDARAPAFCAKFGMQLTVLVLLPPLIWRAGKPAAAVRFDALTALYSMLSKRLEGVDVSPLLCPEIQFVPLLVQSMDEDWYVDTRKVACCAMEAFIKACGAQMSDELRRSIYPELNKRMDDSSNDVRIATAAAVAAFARHALPETYCDTNSGYLVAAFIIHLDDSDARVQQAVLYALRELKLKKPAVVRTEVSKVYDNFRAKHLLDEVLGTSVQA